MIVFVLIRSVPFLLESNCFSTDPDAYLALAEQWYRCGVFAQPGGDGIAEPKPTAFRPPLYPWLLSWFGSNKSTIHGGLIFLHIAFGALTALMTWSIAKRVFSPQQVSVGQGHVERRAPRTTRWSTVVTKVFHEAQVSAPSKVRDVRWVAWPAGLAVALDPILLRQSTLIMSETAAAFGATLTWWLWVQLFVMRGKPKVFVGGFPDRPFAWT